MFKFHNDKLNYATIFKPNGEVYVRGVCDYFLISNSDSSMYIKLIIDGVSYLAPLSLVILEEKEVKNDDV